MNLDKQTKFLTNEGYVGLPELISEKPDVLSAGYGKLPEHIKLKPMAVYGIHPVYQLKVSHTKKVVATGDTKVLTKNGKKKIEELTQDDYVYVFDSTYGFTFELIHTVKKLQRKREVYNIGSERNQQYIANGIVIYNE